MKSPIPCYCDTGLAWSQCCGRFLDAGLLPADPETLMRSRYSAFCRGQAEYLLKTWHPDTRPMELDLAADKALKWVGLKIEWKKLESAEAWVHFIARYKIRGKLERLIETSHFVYQQGSWFYLSGVIANSG